MHTTFYVPSSSGQADQILGRGDSSPLAVVDQKSPGQIGLRLSWINLSYIFEKIFNKLTVI